jgi:hypothetical protein
VQHFDPEGLASELGDAGFSVLEVLGDVAGAPYDPGSHEFAVVASPIVSRE